MAKTPAASPIEFGTDEWGTWATGVQARLDELAAAANGASAEGVAEKIAALGARLDTVEAQQGKYDDFLKSISEQGNASYEKIEAFAKERNDAVGELIERVDALENASHKKGKSATGDDVGARVAALETMLGLHPEHVTAEAEAKEDETLPT